MGISVMKKKKVSVIIPVYNAEKYLKECLESIISQSLIDCEFICINDGSTDNSEEILMEYAGLDDRFVIISQQNRGYGAAVNHGIAAAKGEYIGIVEPDDYIDKDMFKKLYEVATNNDLDIVSSDYRWFYDEEKKRIFEERNVFSDEQLYEKVLSPQSNFALIRGNFINPAGLFKTNFLHEIKLALNETPGAAFQDRGFCILSLIQANRIMVIRERFYNYRQDNPNSSIAGRDDTGKVICEYRNTFIKLMNLPNEYKKFLPVFFRREYESCRYALSRTVSSAQKNAIYQISEEFVSYREKKELDTSDFPYELYEQLLFIMNKPEEAYLSLSGLKNELHIKLKKYERFVIYGAGVVGKRFLSVMDKSDIEKFEGFVVTHVKGNRNILNGFSIKKIIDYVNDKEEIAVIIAVTSKYRKEIIDNLDRLGFKKIIEIESLGGDI